MLFEIEIGVKIENQSNFFQHFCKEKEHYGMKCAFVGFFFSRTKLNIYGGLNFDLCGFAILFVDTAIINGIMVFYIHLK